MDIQEIKHWIATNRIHDMYQDSEVKSLLNWSVDEIAQLRRELEEIKELHRIQIAAICSATLQNTDSTVKDRIKPDNPYWSVAYGDVCNAIDREIKERKRADLNERALAIACEEMVDQDGHGHYYNREPEYFIELAESK